MLSTLLCILLVTAVLEAIDHPKNITATVSSPLIKLSNVQSIPNENQILSSDTKTTKTEVSKANDIIIQQEHNLLGIIMSIVTRLMEINTFTLSDLNWEILSRIFHAVTSVIFGPNANILWPELVNIAVPFLSLLTS